MLGLYLHSCESELVGASNFFRLHSSHLQSERIFNYSLSLDKEALQKYMGYLSESQLTRDR